MSKCLVCLQRVDPHALIVFVIARRGALFASCFSSAANERDNDDDRETQKLWRLATKAESAEEACNALSLGVRSPRRKCTVQRPLLLRRMVHIPSVNFCPLIF